MRKFLATLLIALMLAPTAAYAATSDDTNGKVVVVALIIGYFLPAIVASLRRHANAAAILILNLFLGWTFLGWVIALIWSATSNIRPKTIPTWSETSGRWEPKEPTTNIWTENKLLRCFVIAVAIVGGIFLIPFFTG
jgi:hypothetical protein